MANSRCAQVGSIERIYFPKHRLSMQLTEKAKQKLAEEEAHNVAEGQKLAAEEAERDAAGKAGASRQDDEPAIPELA